MTDLFDWNISLFFIRIAWLWLIKGDKPQPMATWWHIGRLYWCIHPRFGLSYRTKAFLRKEYIRHQTLKEVRVGNLKELW